MLFICNQKELNLKKSSSVIYFYAERVFYHKKMLYMLDCAEKLMKSANFYAVDADYFENLIKIFDIESLPTVIITDNNGKEKDRIVGLFRTKEFLARISSK